tara:strand:+ start:136 stop:372 length:237 start_codon:yes stop_codon:yes gene_type:complete
MHSLIEWIIVCIQETTLRIRHFAEVMVDILLELPSRQYDIVGISRIAVGTEVATSCGVFGGGYRGMIALQTCGRSRNF